MFCHTLSALTTTSGIKRSIQFISNDRIALSVTQAESRVQSVEQSMKTVHIQLEEMKSVRIDMERQIIMWKDDCGNWKKKYENVARLRIEDVDSLKKRFTVQVAELQDQLDRLVNAMKQMEQQKSRLQQGRT
jgi:DNA repair ATPase RecN